MFENTAMVEILIAISLVLLAVLGLAALWMEGRSRNADVDPSPKKTKRDGGR